MKITVEISDDFIEDDKLTDAIKNDIIYSVSSNVRLALKKQIDDEIEKVVKLKVLEECNSLITKTINEFAEKGTMVSGGKEVLIKDHLKAVFTQNSGWNNPNAAIQKLADHWAKQLKTAYDGAFVTEIVKRMNETGLLKPEAASFLLQKPN